MSTTTANAPSSPSSPASLSSTQSSALSSASSSQAPTIISSTASMTSSSSSLVFSEPPSSSPSLSSSSAESSSMASSSSSSHSSSSSSSISSSSSSSSSSLSSSSSSSSASSSSSTPPPSSSSSSSSFASSSSNSTPEPSSSSQSSSEVLSDPSSSIPITTIPIPSTLSSRIFITTTDSRGSTTASAPSIVTTFSTSTQQDGSLVTVTQVFPNPTLNSDRGSSKENSFFANTGAVAGVFVLVGLAAVSILLFIFFAIRRRHRTARLEHDTAVSATLAAAGFHRTPLDDDDAPYQDNGGGGNARHSTVYNSSVLDDPFQPLQMQRVGQSATGGAVLLHSIPGRGAGGAYLNNVNLPIEDGEFDPYAESRGAAVTGGSASGQSTGMQHPPSAFTSGFLRDRSSSSGFGLGAAEMGAAASASASAHHHNHSNSGSFEPLLSSYYANQTGNNRGSMATSASFGAGGTGNVTTPPSPALLPPVSGSNTSNNNLNSYPPAYTSASSSNGDVSRNRLSATLPNDLQPIPGPPSPDAEEPLLRISTPSSPYVDNDHQGREGSLVDVDNDGEPREEGHSRRVLEVRNVPDGQDDAISLISM